jgi:hypothetical protein
MGRRNFCKADKKDVEDEQVAHEACANEGRYTDSPFSNLDRQGACPRAFFCTNKNMIWADSGLDTEHSLLGLHNP